MLCKYKYFVICVGLVFGALIYSTESAVAQQDFLMLNYLDVEQAIDQKIKEIKAIKYKFESDTLSKKGSIVFSLTNVPSELWIILYYNQSGNMWEDIYDIDRITYNYYEGELDMSTIDCKDGSLKEMHYNYEGNKISLALVLYEGNLKYENHYAYDIQDRLRWIKVTSPKKSVAEYKIEFAYDESGKLVNCKYFEIIDKIEVLIEETQYEFDSEGVLANSIKTKSGEIIKTKYMHNDQGYKIKEICYNAFNKKLYEIQYRYSFFK